MSSRKAYSSREVAMFHMKRHFPCGGIRWYESDSQIDAIDTYVCQCRRSMLYACSNCGRCLACRILRDGNSICDHAETISSSSRVRPQYMTRVVGR